MSYRIVAYGVVLVVFLDAAADRWKQERRTAGLLDGLHHTALSASEQVTSASRSAQQKARISTPGQCSATSRTEHEDERWEGKEDDVYQRDAAETADEEWEVVAVAVGDVPHRYPVTSRLAPLHLSPRGH